MHQDPGGGGALYGREWFQLKWAGQGRSSEQNITVKELLPIVIAAAIWGQAWGGKTVRAQRYNMAVNWDIFARFPIDQTL